MNNRGCYLARLLGRDDCDGYLQAAHWVPKARVRDVLRKRGVPAAEIGRRIWDPALTAPSCEKCHRAFDRKLDGFRLTESQYPDNFRQWAADNDFEFRGPRDGWVGIHVEPESAA